ncbi:hypothetical protein ABFX02_10G148300 [Erythranthe guttata]
MQCFVYLPFPKPLFSLSLFSLSSINQSNQSITLVSANAIHQSETEKSNIRRGFVQFEVGAMAGRDLLLFLALTIVSSSLLVQKALGNSEGDALYALRRSLSDPDNVLQSWDPNLVNPCTWFHITCNQDNHVTRVDLGNSNLSGHLVPELGKLENLQYLELYKNNIQGTIPKELSQLKSLISLDLYNNNMTGTIPSSLGKLKSLVFLRLNDNQLNGPIPRALTSISSLKVVDVSNNNLCGTIPTTGPFEHIPLNNFENNPRLEGPELQGLASYDTNCS